MGAKIPTLQPASSAAWQPVHPPSLTASPFAPACRTRSSFCRVQYLSLPLSELRDHQEDALLAVETCGGAGWLVCNFRVRLSAAQQRKRGVEKLDLAFAARIGQVVSARIDEARTGLPLDWWQQHAVELPRQRSGGVLSWDPTPLAEAV